MSRYPTTGSGIYADGTSYNEFYSLPQWTHHNICQPLPSHPQQYSPSSLVPYPHQYTYSDVPYGPVGQSQSSIIHNAPEQPIRRKRASRPKVRTGCTTCKVRVSQVQFSGSLFWFFCSLDHVSAHRCVFLGSVGCPYVLLVLHTWALLGDQHPHLGPGRHLFLHFHLLILTLLS